MFSLIITIISIALVAALALATIYYGGSAFNKGSADAKASQFINEGQQLNGAITMNKADVTASTSNVDGSSSVVAASTVAGLSPAYLSQVPAGWDTTQAIGDSGTATSFVQRTGIRDDVCASINTKAGFGASATLATATDVTSQYGCFGSGSNNGTFVYRY